MLLKAYRLIIVLIVKGGFLNKPRFPPFHFLNQSIFNTFFYSKVLHIYFIFRMRGVIGCFWRAFLDFSNDWCYNMLPVYKLGWVRSVSLGVMEQNIPNLRRQMCFNWKKRKKMNLKNNFSSTNQRAGNLKLFLER